MALTMRCPDEAATRDLGRRLGRVLEPGPCLSVHLQGNLGAGKTTMVRGVLAALGHDGPVRSPTYALVERYAVAGLILVHFDLYRLGDPEELEFLGWRDLLDEADAAFFEWPERARGVLAAADIEIRIEFEGPGRQVRIDAATRAGEGVLTRMMGPKVTC